MKSRASIENDATRIRDEIAGAPDRRALADIYDRADYKGLPTAEKMAMQALINARWRVVL